MTRPKLIILCGIPGSGKSTYAKTYTERNYNTIHLSSDEIRKELYGDENIQGNPGEVFTLMQKRAVEAFNNGYSVLYDDIFIYHTIFIARIIFNIFGMSNRIILF